MYQNGGTPSSVWTSPPLLRELRARGLALHGISAIAHLTMALLKSGKRR